MSVEFSTADSQNILSVHSPIDHDHRHHSLGVCLESPYLSLKLLTLDAVICQAQALPGLSRQRAHKPFGQAAANSRFRASRDSRVFFWIQGPGIGECRSPARKAQVSNKDLKANTAAASRLAIWESIHALLDMYFVTRSQ